MELSQYVLEALRSDEEFFLYPGGALKPALFALETNGLRPAHLRHRKRLKVKGSSGTRDLRRDRFAFWANRIMDLPVLSAPCERQGPTRNAIKCPIRYICFTPTTRSF